MSKPQVVTQAEIKRYRDDIKDNGVAGVIRTYDALLTKGYDYAGWAKGVAEAEGMSWNSLLPKGSVTGRAAVMFLKESSGKDLSEAQLNKIRVGMAQGYLNFLETNIKKNVVKDVDFESMRNFHKAVFERNGLSINNWTLETPMKLIGRYEGGKAAQERKWEELRETQGTNVDALLGSAGLFGRVMNYSTGSIYRDEKGEVLSSTSVANLSMPSPYWYPGEVGDVDSYVSSFKKVPIDANDKREAQEWIKHVSLFKPILFAQSEQFVQPVQNIAQASLDINQLMEQMKTGSVDFSQLNLSQLTQNNLVQLNDLKQQSIQQAETLNKMEQTMTAQAEPAQNIEPETRSRGRSL